MNFKSHWWQLYQVKYFRCLAESSGKLILLGGPAGDKQDPLQSKLNKVEQLTGFSDPVYAEAYVNVNQYDIVLDVLVVNQTADTLQVYILHVPRREDQKYPEYAASVNWALYSFL